MKSSLTKLRWRYGDTCTHGRTANEHACVKITSRYEGTIKKLHYDVDAMAKVGAVRIKCNPTPFEITINASSRSSTLTLRATRKRHRPQFKKKQQPAMKPCGTSRRDRIYLLHLALPRVLRLLLLQATRLSSLIALRLHQTNHRHPMPPMPSLPCHRYGVF